MKYSIENITREDINIIKKYDATYNEGISAIDFVEVIENEIIKCNNPSWEKMYIALYAYKLGVMHGKREERARRGSKIVNGKDTN